MFNFLRLCKGFNRSTYSPIPQEEPTFSPLAPELPSQRRSERLAQKPRVEYTNSAELATEMLQSLCEKQGWVYSDLLVEDFLTWLSNINSYNATQYYVTFRTDVPLSLNKLVKKWATDISDDLQKQHFQKLCYGGIVRYCKQNGITYDPVMTKLFDEWMADPANKDIIIATTNDRYGTHVYKRQPAYCVKKWFATLDKHVTL